MKKKFVVLLCVFMLGNILFLTGCFGKGNSEVEYVLYANFSDGGSCEVLSNNNIRISGGKLMVKGGKSVVVTAKPFSSAWRVEGWYEGGEGGAKLADGTYGSYSFSMPNNDYTIYVKFVLK